MLKTYELTDRHFGWERPPSAATAPQRLAYLLERALRSQGVISVDSACYGENASKAGVTALIARRVARKELVPVQLVGSGTQAHWASPADLAALETAPAPELTHILSPFDPLIIQRKRTKLIFGYDHVFEAYIPADKRKYGYFTLPVLVEDEIVAMLDLKTDRQARQLRIQAWHWVAPKQGKRHKPAVEAALERFEKFQLG